MKYISASDLYKKIKSKDNFYLIDVREKVELITEGFIGNPINIPLDEIQNQINMIKNKESEIVIYCSKGIRSLNALSIFMGNGFNNIYSLNGGFDNWKIENYPVMRSDNSNDLFLSDNNLDRFKRQIKLKEIGLEGQKKLLNSKILVVGAGGLGSPILYYLASSGIGNIGIVDYDVVDLTNLHRQILHFNSDIGRLKTDSAKEKIKSINPVINVITFNQKIDQDNSEKIIKDFDLVIDGTDNFKTKYIINDTCYKLNIPYIYGSIQKFEGQVSLFTFKTNTPCYRCLFPETVENNSIPDCSEAGILGVLPGIIGTIQATEAIKCLLNIGDLLQGQLLLYNSLDVTLKKIKINRNLNCSLCNN